MIAIVDYGAANLLSISRALAAVGAAVEVTDRPRDIAEAEAVVLPGVGAAGTAMERLRASGADGALRAAAATGRPLLGLCLGMQLLFTHLAEDDVPGLGVLPGTVPLLPRGDWKIPHMGWNTLTWQTGARGTALFDGLAPGVAVYFVHSYHCLPERPADAIAFTEHGGPVCAAVAAPAPPGVRAPTVYGLQFHPEKSGAAGLRLLANWLALARMARRGPDLEARP
jgi:imidazole glycerol-phosphate synthase subunit HisH